MSACCLVSGRTKRLLSFNESQAEQLLQKEREWLRVILASIADGMIMTDTEGRVSFTNSTAASLTGWSVAEVSGQLLEVIFKIVIVNEFTHHVVENPAVNPSLTIQARFRGILLRNPRKDEFLAALAHELWNPLTPIYTGLELMRMVSGDQVRRANVTCVSL